MKANSIDFTSQEQVHFLVRNHNEQKPGLIRVITGWMASILYNEQKNSCGTV